MINSKQHERAEKKRSPTAAPRAIAKLRLGFQVSGFEYSEVYGPLVRLTYLVGEARRNLYKARTVPIRSAE